MSLGVRGLGFESDLRLGSFIGLKACGFGALARALGLQEGLVRAPRFDVRVSGGNLLAWFGFRV